MGAAERLAWRARQVVASRTSDVPSPCVSVCRMDPVTDGCEGCFRTLDEIAAWGRMEDEEKREVWRLIVERVQARALDPAHSKGGRQQDSRQRT